MLHNLVMIILVLAVYCLGCKIFNRKGDRRAR